MSDQKIMDFIPASLHEKLIEEVKELLSEKEKKKSNEISPDMKEYLKNKKESEDKQRGGRIEKIVNQIM